MKTIIVLVVLMASIMLLVNESKADMTCKTWRELPTPPKQTYAQGFLDGVLAQTAVELLVGTPIPEVINSTTLTATKVVETFNEICKLTNDSLVDVLFISKRDKLIAQGVVK